MSDLRELYQQVILDHHKRPRNFRKIAAANRHAEGYNPLCGDKINLYLNIDDQGVIRDIAFEGSGCAISTASASMMTESLKGKTETEVRATFERFHALVTGTDGAADGADLGKLAVFSGVRDYPVRIKCAVLCWHTLRAALDQAEEAVATE
jgi:nitrogen fixation protein NifU and related proteins